MKKITSSEIKNGLSMLRQIIDRGLINQNFQPQLQILKGQVGVSKKLTQKDIEMS